MEHEREREPPARATGHLPAQEPLAEMAGGSAADPEPRPFLVRRLSDAAEPELLVGLRRHSELPAGRADRDRRRAGHALYPRCGSRVQFRRAYHARRELGLAAALCARDWRLDVLPGGLRPHVPRPLLRLLQGSPRGAVDP